MMRDGGFSWIDILFIFSYYKYTYEEQYSNRDQHVFLDDVNIV